MSCLQLVLRSILIGIRGARGDVMCFHGYVVEGTVDSRHIGILYPFLRLSKIWFFDVENVSWSDILSVTRSLPTLFACGPNASLPRTSSLLRHVASMATMKPLNRTTLSPLCQSWYVCWPWSILDSNHVPLPTLSSSFAFSTPTLLITQTNLWFQIFRIW